MAIFINECINTLWIWISGVLWDFFASKMSNFHCLCSCFHSLHKNVMGKCASSLRESRILPNHQCLYFTQRTSLNMKYCDKFGIMGRFNLTLRVQKKTSTFGCQFICLRILLSYFSWSGFQHGTNHFYCSAQH